jgi:hypothetical protein
MEGEAFNGVNERLAACTSGCEAAR